MPTPVDLIRQLIEFIGDDPDRPGLQETPRRVVDAWSELFSGYGADLRKILKTFPYDPDVQDCYGRERTPLPLEVMNLEPGESFHLNESFRIGRQLVVVQDIDLFSTCEHHLVPFSGLAHVAYIPDGQIVGLSKIPRLVDAFARRLQVQERLTHQIVEALTHAVNPIGVLVAIQARHLCMCSRGVRQSNAQTWTVLGSGILANPDHPDRVAFLSMIQGGHR